MDIDWRGGLNATAQLLAALGTHSTNPAAPGIAMQQALASISEQNARRQAYEAEQAEYRRRAEDADRNYQLRADKLGLDKDRADREDASYKAEVARFADLIGPGGPAGSTPGVGGGASPTQMPLVSELGFDPQQAARVAAMGPKAGMDALSRITTASPQASKSAYNMGRMVNGQPDWSSAIAVTPGSPEEQQALAQGMVRLRTPTTVVNVGGDGLLRSDAAGAPAESPTGRPQRAFDNTKKSYEELVAQASGTAENFGQMLDNIAGGLFGLPPRYTETAEAKRQSKLINKSVELGMVESDKFAVHEVKRVLELMPDPDAFFRGDEQAMRDAAALRTYLRELHKQYVYERDVAPNVTEKARNNAADKAVTLERILSMMGGPGGEAEDLSEMSDDELRRQLGL